MAHIIAILNNDSRGHQIRLSDGKELTVPYSAAHSLSIGDEYEPPKGPEHFPKFDIETGTFAPPLAQLHGPAQVAANILSKVVNALAVDTKSHEIPSE